VFHQLRLVLTPLGSERRQARVAEVGNGARKSQMFRMKVQPKRTTFVQNDRKPAGSESQEMPVGDVLKLD
jgi:hypothetical protein